MPVVKKMKKKTTDSEPFNNEHVINKGYLDEKLLKKIQKMSTYLKHVEIIKSSASLTCDI